MSYANRLKDLDKEYANTKMPERSDYGPIPDGTYRAIVDAAYIKESKSGNLMLEWELCIQGPRYTGRKVWRRNMLQSGDNLAYLCADLATVGVDLAGKLSDLENHLPKIACCEVMAKLKTNGEWHGKPNQNVYLAAVSKAGEKSTPPAVDEDALPF